jgi:hypothetical protein
MSAVMPNSGSCLGIKTAIAAATIVIERRAHRLRKSNRLSARPTADIETTARLQNRSVTSCPIAANSDILETRPSLTGIECHSTD